MSPLFGYFVCLVVLLPALSLEVLFRLIGKTTYLPEVFPIYRTILQMLATVTSPVRIALATAVLLFAYAAESCWAKRVVGVMAFGLAGFLCFMQIVALSHASGSGVSVVMMCSSVASLLSFSWSSNAVETAATC
jgi:hypothetical protein